MWETTLLAQLNKRKMRILFSHASAQRTQTTHTHTRAHTRTWTGSPPRRRRRTIRRATSLSRSGRGKKSVVLTRNWISLNQAEEKTVSRRRMIRGFLIDSAKNPQSFSLPRLNLCYTSLARRNISVWVVCAFFSLCAEAISWALIFFFFCFNFTEKEIRGSECDGLDSPIPSS